MRKIWGEKNSILRKILIPLLAVMLLQTGLSCGAIIFGGTVSRMKENAFTILGEKVSNRGNILQTDMIERWSNLESAALGASMIISDMSIAEGMGHSTIGYKSELSQKLLSSLSEQIIYLLRRNAVTGAFLVLEGDNPDLKDGLYFYDSDPDVNPAGYSDLLAARAPSDITRELGIALDTLWEPHFDFSNMTSQGASFYTTPFKAAQNAYNDGNGKSLADSDLGYWSPPFYLNEGNAQKGEPIITYSLPIRDRDGKPLGVIGVELSIDFLCEKLPPAELNSELMGGYLLAVGQKTAATQKDGTYQPVAVSGAYFKANFPAEEAFTLSTSSKNGVYTLQNKTFETEKIYAAAIPLKLYNTNTPFEKDQWILVGAVTGKQLFSFSNEFIRILLFSFFVTMLVGIVGISIVAKRITHPIQRLVAHLKLDAAPSAALTKTGKINIVEIDQMLESIEYYSKRAIDSASRLSKILELTGVSIGAFEYGDTGENSVLCTAGLADLIGLDKSKVVNGKISGEMFEEHMYSLLSSGRKQTDGSIIVCRTKDKGVTNIEQDEQWIQIRKLEFDKNILGVVTDVTQEVLERKRIEHDRDYDLLTNIYNRRAFQEKVKELFEKPEQLKISGMLMFDLDNLKYINDTYGHDYGDEYIRATARVLEKFLGEGRIAARQSGDEFTLFVYGCEDKASVRKICKALLKEMQEARIYMPNSTAMQIRASMGVSWYPDDAQNYEDLIHYADFAMYMVKRSHKGELTEFSKESYSEKSYLLHCREELNMLIEGSMVSFHFQPIIDAHTGDIFAYEALIRPQTPNIKSPAELLSLAQSQSKLLQIERLTFFGALRDFDSKPIARLSCKLFINSIANQMLDGEEIAELEREYAPYLSRIVVEITENENSDAVMSAKKQGIVKSWGSEVALDDYGTGYNGDAILLALHPDYVKLDYSMVHDIHTDKSRLQLLRNLVSFGKENDAKIIAEGVECYEEMETLIREGVQYMQGYYFAKPSADPPLVLLSAKEKIQAINRECEKSERLNK